MISFICSLSLPVLCQLVYFFFEYDPRVQLAKELHRIDRTLSQLGNYEIDPDTLTVRLNARSKFLPLSEYLVQSVSATPSSPKKQRRRSLWSKVCARFGGASSLKKQRRQSLLSEAMLSLRDDGDDEKHLDFGSPDGLQLGPDLDDPLGRALRRCTVITLESLLSLLMAKGRLLIEMRSLERAEELFSFVIEENEALIRYHRLVNPHHIEREEQFEGAQRVMVPPGTPFHRLTKGMGLEDCYAARGDIHFKSKRLNEALCDFSNAIRFSQSEKKSIYYNLRGVCFHEMKDYGNALEDYDNAVQSTYGNHVAWNNRAALLVEMSDFDAAIDATNEAIRMDPSYGNAYKHRGVAYHLKGEFEAAITDINRCIKLLPDYGPGHLALQSIWNNVFDGVSVVSRQGVPLELIQIVVDYTVGSGCRDDEDMVHSTKR